MQNIMIYIAMVFIMLQAGGCTTTAVGVGAATAVGMSAGTVDPVQYSNTPEFGSSVRLAASEQTANPEAGGDAPVVGIDGKYAAAAAKKYQEGPRDKQESQSSSIFGVVGGN